MSTPATADVVRLYETGGPEVLRVETEDVAEPGHGQVRLRQEALGLNYVDTFFRDGTFPLPVPRVIGVEAAGVVDAVGDGVTEFAVGDRAGYYFSPGAYREYRIIEASQLIPLPDDVAFGVAASILAKGLTAWARLRRVHPVGEGTLAVVTGASGGVGSLLAPWARRLGADVIAVVARPEAVAPLHALGVDDVAVAGTGELQKLVERVGRPVDVAYDQVGQAVIGELIGVLGQGSLLDLLGSASGDAGPSLDAALGAGIRIARSSTGEHLPTRQVLLHATDELFDALRTGVFGDRVPHSYPLEDVVQAHRDIEARAAGPAPILIP